MTNPGEQLEVKRDEFGRLFESEGLEKACKATAPLSFWIKYYVPSSFHSTMKKIYHMIVDK